jgi:uncharacterized membrane protein
MAPMRETWKSVRNSFFAGLLVIMPLAGSILILLSLFTWVTDFMLPDQLRRQMFTPLYRIAALLVFIIFTTLVGWITRLVVGRRMIALGEAIIARVPLLNKTYIFIKEISHTLFSGRKTMFQRVVLVEYPRAGVYTIGFVTSDAIGETQAKTPEPVINVFFPTTPNPTSGWLALVPRSQVTELDMSVADGMRLIVSGGAVVPPFTPKPQSPAAPSSQ